MSLYLDNDDLTLSKK